MRQFADIDPLIVAKDSRVVASIDDPTDPETKWYFLIDENHLIIADVAYRKKRNKWLHYQIEFPKRGLRWFLDTLQGKFFKTETEAEGGLPKGQFHDKTEIEGERIKLGRAFNADGNRGGGYSFVTLDRKEDDLSKEYTFTDVFLFDHGLFQIFQDIASRIEVGQL